MLAAAPPPEGDRGSAGPQHAARDARRDGRAAVRAAAAIGYVGAGTVEFIADVADGLEPERFYFMEMNTRLQVEHPVTELITGLDLVEWQLRIAAGEPLPLGQHELAIDGHAIEARLYAEDPAKGFLPSTGRLRHLAIPPASRGPDRHRHPRRATSITSFYDPLLAKLIVHGRDRDHALNLMATALEQVEVVGCATNATFLGALVRDAEFAAGKVDTGLIERRLDALLAAAQPETTDALVIAALDAIGIFEPAPDDDPWSALKGWRLWRGARQFAHLGRGEARLDLPVLFMDDGGFEVQLETGSVIARVVRQVREQVTLDLGDRLIGATVIRGDGEVSVFIDGRLHRFELTDHLAAEAGGAVADNRVVAPMPGRIVLLEVSEGDSVAAGARIAVLEAMKMEQALTAPVAGDRARPRRSSGRADRGGHGGLHPRAGRVLKPPVEPGNVLRAVVIRNSNNGVSVGYGRRDGPRSLGARTQLLRHSSERLLRHHVDRQAPLHLNVIEGVDDDIHDLVGVLEIDGRLQAHALRVVALEYVKAGTGVALGNEGPQLLDRPLNPRVRGRHAFVPHSFSPAARHSGQP